MSAKGESNIHKGGFLMCGEIITAAGAFVLSVAVCAVKNCMKHIAARGGAQEKDNKDDQNGS